MKRYLVREGTMTAIADAVRSKTGSTEQLDPAGMAEQIALIRTYEGDPVLEGVTIMPTGTEIVKVPPHGIDGFGIVTVEGDQNLVPENIKEGVVIYGVEGSLNDAGIDTSDATATPDDIMEGATAYVDGVKITGTHVCAADPILEALSITPTGAELTYAPGDGVDGYSEVTVDGDENLVSENVKKGVTIYGVEGSLEAGNLQEKEVTPTAAGVTVEPDKDYSGLSKVVVQGDANLIADNIKSGVSIFGVNGSLILSDLPLKDFIVIDPTAEAQRIEPDSEHSGFGFVMVSGDEDLVPKNIRRGVEVFGTVGSANCSDLILWSSDIAHDNGFIMDPSDSILDLSYGGDS